MEFALEWVLSGGRDNSRTGALNRSCPHGGQTRARLRPQLVKKQPLLMLVKSRRCFWYFVAWPTFQFCLVSVRVSLSDGDVL